MSLLREIWEMLVQELGWALTLTGAGMVLLGAFWRRLEASRRLTLIIAGVAMIVTGQMVFIAHQGNWTLTFFIGAGLAILATLFILSQVIQIRLIEPASRRAFNQPKGPVTRAFVEWLKRPGQERLKRYLAFFFMSDREDRRP